MNPEQPSPTQLMEQATFQPANMPPEFNLSQDMVQAFVALQLAAENAELKKDKEFIVSVLQQMLNHYLELANSGDAGNWNPEDEEIVKFVRTAIDAARKKQS